MTTNVMNKPSALDALKALAGKKPVAGNSAIAVQMNDPAIAGSKRNKNTVTLGVDPDFTNKARHAAELKKALDEATAAFTILQGEVRDYGRGKRGKFNDTFKADITTVCIPYTVESTDGPEQKLVQVVCQNKYSVNKETVLNNRSEFGENFDRLFAIEETKSLKPNAEELIRSVFAEAGLEQEALESAMDSLFETVTKVSTKENFEQESKKVSDVLKSILDVSVTRAQPSLKFPDLG